MKPTLAQQALATEWSRAVDRQASHRICGFWDKPGEPTSTPCGAPAFWRAEDVYTSSEDALRDLFGIDPSDAVADRFPDEVWLCSNHTFACPIACPLCGMALGAQGERKRHMDPSGTRCAFMWSSRPGHHS